ncbi:hypothetical protein F2Q69_00014147 [Brassica cretica]|uniref:PB1-like domain-containing protein n=1 Tax=Brassica cretica TaxID=69181 RepID=A0A8S9QU42_BRACR|nr:hypothetical protein F2Q69_00014147 [Brassica cretica]
MSDEDDKLKMHVHYGGVMSKEGEKLCYVGGEVAPDMLVDPDLLTFSIFEDFTRTRQVVSDVKKVWYRLPNEEISSARLIWEDKDCEILKMASEAQKCGEVYIYVEHSVSPIDVVDAAGLVNELSRNGEEADAEDGSEGDESEEESDDENREEESDEEVIEEHHEEIYEEEDGQDGGQCHLRLLRFFVRILNQMKTLRKL